ncbi:uncharacterized protein [Amphiura filiformis]|uniref:uncharacterized protein n=1 Tax=Amphiura filiformis TaxID=82378 RepID=UPI003B22556E
MMDYMSILLITCLCFLQAVVVIKTETSVAPFTTAASEANSTQPSSEKGSVDNGKETGSNSTQSDTTFPSNATESNTTNPTYPNATDEPQTNETYTVTPVYENSTYSMRTLESTPNVTMETNVSMSTLSPEQTDSTNGTSSLNDTDFTTTDAYTTSSFNHSEETTSPVFVSPNETSSTNSTDSSNTTDVYTTQFPDVSEQPNTNDTNVTSTIPPSTQITMTTTNLTTVMPNITTEYSYQNETDISTPNVTTLRTTSSNFTTVSYNTTMTTRLMSTRPATNDTTTSQLTTTMLSNVTLNSTQSSSIQPTSQQMTTNSLTSSAVDTLPVTFVLAIVDTDHKPVIGPIVQLSSRSFDTIRIQLHSSSHIVRKTVFVKKGDGVVLMAIKPGYATNSLRWIHSDKTLLVILLAKLQPALVSIVEDTVHIVTTSNEADQSASIQFPMSTMDWTNLSASYLLTSDLTLLPDPTSNNDKSKSGIVSLVPYAAIQLTLHNGDIPVTMVMGDFAMVIPISDDVEEFKNGNKIPAWYFDENSGSWVRNGEGTVRKASSGVMMWHFSAPHLSWWMAATQVEILEPPISKPPKKGLLGSLNGMQFITILIISCLGVFGIGAMIILICIKPKEMKGIQQNGSSRSRKSRTDSDSVITGSNTHLANNIELKENPNDEDLPLPPPPPPLEPPTVSIGMDNHGMDSDTMDEIILQVPDNDTKFDETSSYIYSTHLDVSDCNDKIDDSSSFVYTNNTFLNVGGQKDRSDTASILDAFPSDDDSQSASHGPSEDESSISYQENIVV